MGKPYYVYYTIKADVALFEQLDRQIKSILFKVISTLLACLQNRNHVPAGPFTLG